MTRAKTPTRFLCLLLSVALAATLSLMAMSDTAHAATGTAKPKLSKTSVSVYKGKTYTLKLKNAQSGKKVKWSTSNKKVVSVKQSGNKAVVKGVKAGKATVTAKYGSKKYKCTVTVKSKPVALSKTSVSLKKGTKYTLKLRNATASKVKWSSSNKSVATVSKNGVVTAKKAGKATVTAKYGSKKYKCNVTVKAPSALSVSSKNVTVKGTAAVTIKFTKNGSVDWNVSDPTIASCEWEGGWKGDKITLKIYGEKVGRTKITISNSCNKETETITVNVKKASSVGPQILNMAAYGIDAAWSAAKYPSTLRINEIYYKKSRTNGYGETIHRMVIRCYSMNGFGGYSDYYVVVLRSSSPSNYGSNIECNGYYLNISVYDSDPGTESRTLDNETAMDAYRNIIDGAKNIPFD